MSTIASLTTTANQIAKLLDLAVEPLNEKLKETGHKVIFRQVQRGKNRVVEPFLLKKDGWRTEINLSDGDLPVLLDMQPEAMIDYLKAFRPVNV